MSKYAVIKLHIGKPSMIHERLLLMLTESKSWAAQINHATAIAPPIYYWIEITIAPLSYLTSNDNGGKLEFIGCINW